MPHFPRISCLVTSPAPSFLSFYRTTTTSKRLECTRMRWSPLPLAFVSSSTGDGNLNRLTAGVVTDGLFMHNRLQYSSDGADAMACAMFHSWPRMFGSAMDCKNATNRHFGQRFEAQPFAVKSLSRAKRFLSTSAPLLPFPPLLLLLLRPPVASCGFCLTSDQCRSNFRSHRDSLLRGLHNQENAKYVNGGGAVSVRQTKRFFSTSSSSPPNPPPPPPPPPNMSCAELVSRVRLLAKQGAKNTDPASVDELAAAAIALSSQMDAKQVALSCNAFGYLTVTNDAETLWASLSTAVVRVRAYFTPQGVALCVNAFSYQAGGIS